MKNAMSALLAGALILALVPASAMAGVPEGKIAVVRVTAIDGLAKVDGKLTESRATAFRFDGSNYMIDRAVLGSLDGVKTLVLIDRRKDSAEGSALVRKHSQEVRAIDGTGFEVADLPGKALSYQVAMVGGNLRLLGDGDQILATGGAQGAYHVWRVDSVDLLDASAIQIR